MPRWTPASAALREKADNFGRLLEEELGLAPEDAEDDTHSVDSGNYRNAGTGIATVRGASPVLQNGEEQVGLEEERERVSPGDDLSGFGLGAEEEGVERGSDSADIQS